MNGDLSLSDALGGLRIANPDDEEAVASPSPAASPAPDPFESRSYSREGEAAILPSNAPIPTTYHEYNETVGEGIGFCPQSYTIQNDGRSPVSSHHSRSPTTPNADFRPRKLSHRKSLPISHQAQQSMQYPGQAGAYGQQYRSNQSTSIDPIGGMYQLPNTSTGSAGSYRYRDDYTGPRDGNYDPGRRSSRLMQAPGPERNGSRSYRPMDRQLDGGNGPVPPRRTSQHIRASMNGSESSSSLPHSSSLPQPGNTEEWRGRGAAVTVRRETDSSGQVQTKVSKKGVADFKFGRTLGEGSYSTVLAGTDKTNGKEYAVKVLDKRHIIKEKKVKYVNIERDTLNRLTEHPGIVRLYYTFQDERSLYFVLDLATGGELLGVLKNTGSFDVECTRFYGAQILDSIAYMHSRGVIHRDLKPENVLLDRDMHTKITDFGTAKILPLPKPGNGGTDFEPGNLTDGQDQQRANSFVGTAEYVSPELLQRSSACNASDLWAFGCIIYQLLAGRPPFKAANEYLTFQKIMSLEYSFSDGFPPDARDLVERLLVLDPANRLPVEHIKNHPFFEGVQWGKSLWRQTAPKLRPYVPPTADPIRLNGGSNDNSSASMQRQLSNSQQPRQQLRAVADLPPPSQLDIDWSSVLKSTERILKLGILIVSITPQSNSPNSKSGEAGTPSEKSKFRGFFAAKSDKRKERLVMITSNARLIFAAHGGNEKKAKMEFDCLPPECTWSSFVDVKGLTAFCLDTVSIQTFP